MMLAETAMPEPVALELVLDAACPERRLWRASLLQLLSDSRAWQAQRFTALSPRPHARDAWLMLRDNSQDFRRLCDLAGVDANALRSVVLCKP